MGKVSQKTKRKLKQKSSEKEKLLSLTVEELIKAVQDKINVFDYDAADSCCTTALEKFPDNLKLLELSANTCLEIGKFEEAKLSLEKAITLQPEQGHTKYFSLAQLLSDQNALLCYKKGIEVILKSIGDLKNNTDTGGPLLNGDSSVPLVNGNLKDSKKLDDSGEEIDKTEVNDLPKPKKTEEECLLYRQLSSGYCSIAELYTSDLCDEDEAENECIQNIKNAIESDDTNPEAYIQQANFRLIKEEMEEAKESILKSVTLWLPKYLSVESGEAEAGSFDPVDVCPVSEELRIQSAKILIEVEEYHTAHDILDGLLGEDDEDIQIWYLIGWNFYLQGNDLKVLSKQHLKKALEIHRNCPCPDEQMIGHINELLEEMKEIDDVDSEDDIDDYLNEVEDDDDDDDEDMETN